MPSDHRAEAGTHPAHNGEPEHRRWHKLLFPVPRLKDPIDPALLQHEKKRADAAQNRAADKITAFRGRCCSSISTSSGSAAGGSPT
jgi:hypothetical protein